MWLQMQTDCNSMPALTLKDLRVITGVAQKTWWRMGLGDLTGSGTRSHHKVQNASVALSQILHLQLLSVMREKGNSE